MSKPIVEVQIRAVAATTGGHAVFLGNEDKVFIAPKRNQITKQA
jgi:hypothetical protein